MTYRSQFRELKKFLVLTLLACILLSIPLACAKEQSSIAMLEVGSTVNAKMKSLASGTNLRSWNKTSDIKIIRMADSLPSKFVPSKANTVSTADSDNPIYIFFDNKEDQGIMYFYTKADTVIMNPSSSNLFAYNEALTDISGLINWDTSLVTDMSSLFCGAKSLSDGLALRNWDTSNVTDMSYMFSGASSMKFIDVSNWNTSKVTSMVCMFQVGQNYMGDGLLTEINGLGDWDVSNVTDMTCMFYGAGQMTSYDIARWNVSKVESMNHLFCDNFRLESLNLSSWDVSSVKTIYCMFDDCSSLKTIGDISHWNTINLIDAGGWLNYATKFVGNNEGVLDLSGWDTSNLQSVGEMFLKTKIFTLDLSGWTFDSITNSRWENAGHGIYYETGNDSDTLRGFGQMFKDTPNLKKVYVSQSGLDSFNAAVEREVNILDMWTNSKAEGFTVK